MNFEPSENIEVDGREASERRGSTDRHAVGLLPGVAGLGDPPQEGDPLVPLLLVPGGRHGGVTTQGNGHLLTTQSG